MAAAAAERRRHRSRCLHALQANFSTSANCARSDDDDAGIAQILHWSVGIGAVTAHAVVEKKNSRCQPATLGDAGHDPGRRSRPERTASSARPVDTTATTARQAIADPTQSVSSTSARLLLLLLRQQPRTDARPSSVQTDQSTRGRSTRRPAGDRAPCPPCAACDGRGKRRTLRKAPDSIWH
jgi:hypothetical protein